MFPSPFVHVCMSSNHVITLDQSIEGFGNLPNLNFSFPRLLDGFHLRKIKFRNFHAISFSANFDALKWMFNSVDKTRRRTADDEFFY